MKVEPNVSEVTSKLKTQGDTEPNSHVKKSSHVVSCLGAEYPSTLWPHSNAGGRVGLHTQNIHKHETEIRPSPANITLTNTENAPVSCIEL